MNKFFIRFPLADQILFAKRLSILVGAGTPLLEALQMLSREANSQKVAEILQKIITDVENGQFLSAALSRFRQIFGDFAINIIRVGEDSGCLPENLAYLARELHKKQALRRKVSGALIYPIFIVVATLGITALLLLYVFPKILPIFRGLKFELPWTTKIVIFLSGLFYNYAYYLVFGMILALIFIPLFLKIPKIRFFIDRLILTIPFFGKISKNYHMTNFCRTLGLLLKGEMMIVEAVTVTADTTGNLVYRHEMKLMAENLTKGGSLSKHMRVKNWLFPPTICQMITVAETAGNLSETLLTLSEYYESEVEESTRNLANLLEPMLMIFLGMIVGFVALSIISPIYEITQNLRP